MPRIVVDPITRIEGHLRIEAMVENGTVTDAYTLRVGAAPTEGTRNYAFWVDAGISRFDATDTPTTDPGWTTSSTVDMNAPDGYFHMSSGTQEVVVPYWNT